MNEFIRRAEVEQENLKMKNFIATYKGRTIKVQAISATNAIRTAAKIFKVKMNKVPVRQVN